MEYYRDPYTPSLPPVPGPRQSSSKPAPWWRQPVVWAAAVLALTLVAGCLWWINRKEHTPDEVAAVQIAPSAPTPSAPTASSVPSPTLVFPSAATDSLPTARTARTDGHSSSPIRATGSDTGRQPIATGVGSGLSVSGRYLVDNQGRPFLWQGDTNWTFVVRTTRAEVDQFLDVRQRQGFTLMQIVGIPAVESVQPVNSMGQPAFNGSLANLNEPYWQHVDYIIDQAAKRGIRIAFFPAWSVKVAGDGTLNAGNAQAYGQFLGNRYKNKSLIWVMGGDDNQPRPEVWSALARGIAIGTSGSEDYSKVLMTFHPGWEATGAHSDQKWLDFTMLQSGHCHGKPGEMVNTWYNQVAKPVLNGEPLYEGHPICWDPNQGYSTAAQVRANQYLSVFAGAFGFTYGHQSVWQMYAPGRELNNYPRNTWQEALNDPAATQMIHLRRLLESRPLRDRIPDQSLITSDQFGGEERVQATRDNAGTYAMVYTAAGKGFTLNTSKLSGSSLHAWWYDPRTGKASDAGQKSSGSLSFTPPSEQDWVLVLDAKAYNPPGS